MNSHGHIYPLTAIVGQDALKQALLLGAVHPGIDGILIRGEKGTAKSTMVRALAEILPEITVALECPYSCSPEPDKARCPACATAFPQLQSVRRRAVLVDLPLNATEDRIAGGIDFSRSLRDGQVVFSPGLLARAHRGLLYIDEVNLLDDHLVDLILDAAASGENRIEREGISFAHPASFFLIGTMNPEEGELRPQLLDRFGLCLEISGSQDEAERVLLMERRDEYDQDPVAFCGRFRLESEQLAGRIATARRLLPAVRISEAMRGFIGELCRENNVAGHRADLVMEQAARAFAALEGKREVTFAHVSEVAPMVLLHRRRETTPPPPSLPPQDQEEQEQEEQKQEEQEQNEQERKQEEQQNQDPASRAQENAALQQEETSPERAEQLAEQSAEQPGNQREDQEDSQGQKQAQEEEIFTIGKTFSVKALQSRKDRLIRRGSGRRSRSRVGQKKGRYVKSSMRATDDIAFDATLRAAAPFQRQRAAQALATGPAVHLRPQDLRTKIREKRIGNFLLLVVDASGSMGSRGRMSASKGAIMSLLLDAYQKRDKVAMITFRRQEAFVNLPPTTSVDLAGRLLAEMPVGGRTPLSAGLAKSYEELRNFLTKNPGARPIVIFITDGKSNVALGDQHPIEEALHLAAAMARDERSRYIVVDTEAEGFVTFDLARQLAAAMQAQYFKIDDLRAETLVNIVRGQQE